MEELLRSLLPDVLNTPRFRLFLVFGAVMLVLTPVRAVALRNREHPFVRRYLQALIADTTFSEAQLQRMRVLRQRRFGLRLVVLGILGLPAVLAFGVWRTGPEVTGMLTVLAVVVAAGIACVWASYR